MTRRGEHLRIPYCPKTRSTENFRFSAEGLDSDPADRVADDAPVVSIKSARSQRWRWRHATLRVIRDRASSFGRCQLWSVITSRAIFANILQFCARVLVILGGTSVYG